MLAAPVLVTDLRFVAVYVMEGDVRNVVMQRAAGGEARCHQILHDFVLAVDVDCFAADQFSQRDQMALAAEN